VSATKSINRLGASIQRRDSILSSRSALQGQLLGVAALGAAMAAPIGAAIKFESVMADVRKVVDFETPKQFEEMKKTILDLSRTMPMSPDQIGSIVEVAGQSNIAREELKQFAIDAIKMGVAFDLAGGQAGVIMANWRAGMKLTQDEVVQLAGTVNFLSNNMNATAGDIALVIQRMGATAKKAGLASAETAALSAALLSSGAPVEVVGTALKNMTNALTKGASATKRQAASFEKLGFDAVGMSRRMQVDAQGAILDVLSAINRLDAAEQPAIISDLFGEEAKAAIAPLISNLGNLEKAFKLAGDEASAAGSLTEEYEVRSKTTANAIQLFKNRTTVLGVKLGSVLLPPLNELLGVVGKSIDTITDLAERYPKLTKFVISLGAALVAAKIATVAFRFASTFVTLPLANMAIGFNKMRLRAVLANAKLKAMSFGSLAVKAGTAATRVVDLGAGFGAMAAGGLKKATQGMKTFFAASAVGKFKLMAGGIGSLGATLLKFAGAPIKAVLVGIRAIGIAIIANPIGLLITGIILVGALIFKHWEPIKAFLSGFWDKFKEKMGPLAPAIEWIGNKVGDLFNWFSDLLAPVDASSEKIQEFKNIGEAVGEAVGGSIAFVIEQVESLFNWLSSVANAIGSLFNTSGGVVSNTPAAAAIGGRNRKSNVVDLDGVRKRTGDLSKGQTVNNNQKTDVKITVNQQPGEDGAALAKRVSSQVRGGRNKRNALHDEAA